MDGLHTVIELATPAPVRFEIQNMLLCEGLEYKIVGTAPVEDVEIDAESEDTDEFVRGRYNPSQIVEAQAKLLLVQTISLRRIKESDLIGVYRLEKVVMTRGVPSFLQVLPHEVEITSYMSPRKKQTHEKRAGNHATLVERVMRDFAANTPRILHNGHSCMTRLWKARRRLVSEFTKERRKRAPHTGRTGDKPHLHSVCTTDFPTFMEKLQYTHFFTFLEKSLMMPCAC